MEITVFSCSMVFCTCLQCYAPWIRLFKTQAGDHGIQLQYGTLCTFEMKCTMNQVIQDAGWRWWCSAAAWYFLLVCNDMHHESSYLRHRLEIMVFSCSMVFCTCLQWRAPWIRLFKTQASIMVFSCSMVFCTCLQWHAPWIRLVKTRNGDHGIQLQHGILYLFAMTCTLNQVI